MARNRAVSALEAAVALALTTTQEADATIAPVDARGNAAPIDGAPVWASSDETIVTVVPNPDDRTAIIRATGLAGTANVTATGDADLGEGIEPVIAVVNVTVAGGKAVGVNVTVGAPREQTPA